MWTLLLLVTVATATTECTLAGSLEMFEARLGVTSPYSTAAINAFIESQKANGCIPPYHTYTGDDIVAHCDVNHSGQLDASDWTSANGCILYKFKGVLPDACRLLQCNGSSKK